MTLNELCDNAWDIGTVSGVLQGIEPMLPNQKEAIAKARKAIDRIAERNRIDVDRWPDRVNTLAPQSQ